MLFSLNPYINPCGTIIWMISSETKSVRWTVFGALMSLTIAIFVCTLVAKLVRLRSAVGGSVYLAVSNRSLPAAVSVSGKRDFATRDKGSEMPSPTSHALSRRLSARAYPINSGAVRQLSGNLSKGGTAWWARELCHNLAISITCSDKLL